MSALITFKPKAAYAGGPRKKPRPRFGTHLFLIVMSIVWLIPLGWAMFTAL